jgi:hypothetical protein
VLFLALYIVVYRDGSIATLSSLTTELGGHRYKRNNPGLVFKNRELLPFGNFLGENSTTTAVSEKKT